MMLTIGWSGAHLPNAAGPTAGGPAARSVRLPFGRLLILRLDAHAARTGLAFILDSNRAPLESPWPFFVRALRHLLRSPGKDLEALMQHSMPFEAVVPSVPSRGGTDSLRRAFEPLGYSVTAAAIPLDRRCTDWGNSHHACLTLHGCCSVRDLLRHLTAILPVLDDDTDYARDTGNVEDVLLRGDPWLRYAPERPVVGRYLKRRDERVRRVIRLLTGRDDITAESVTARLNPRQYTPVDLGSTRIDAVVHALKAAGAQSVLDAGCGVGELLQELRADERFGDLAGVDASTAALEAARKRLETAPPGRGRRRRVRLLHGSLQYRDERLRGFDAVTAVEVIEHFDAARLEAFEEILFGDLHPRVAVLTTPNADFNVHLPWIPSHLFRHWDHRFEWNRAQFASWSGRIAERFGYRVYHAPVGPEIAGAGAPTQMAVFERVDPPRSASTPAHGASPAPTRVRPATSLSLDRVTGTRVVRTRLAGPVVLSARRTRDALEHIARFTVDPRWLIYLPPAAIAARARSRTPCEQEHPAAAFGEYRERGVHRVVVQERHAGTRAVIVICRDGETALQRFGVEDDVGGCCYTRHGQRLFHDRQLEREVVASVREALDRCGFWRAFETNWVCLEGALMPRSYRDQRVVRQRYAPLAASAQAVLDATVPALEGAGKHGRDVIAALDRARARQMSTARFVDAYHRSCWTVKSVDDIRLALFHVLATHGVVYSDRHHQWHTQAIDAICAEAPGLLRRTRCHVVDLEVENSGSVVIDWWRSLPADQCDGAIVKPWAFATRDRRRVIVQPALTCRTPEAMRLTLGPDEARWKDASRELGRTNASMRPRAMRQFALGVEALTRFVRGEPLDAVHECVTAVLALEARPARS